MPLGVWEVCMIAPGGINEYVFQLCMWLWNCLYADLVGLICEACQVQLMLVLSADSILAEVSLHL